MRKPVSHIRLKTVVKALEKLCFKAVEEVETDVGPAEVQQESYLQVAPDREGDPCIHRRIANLLWNRHQQASSARQRDSIPGHPAQESVHP